MMRPLARGIAVALVAALASGCAIPGPDAAEAAIAGIPRDRVRVTTDAFSGSLSYLHSGSPRTARVVFVHGTPGSARAWADFLADVPDGEEYIALDRPGFGESEPDGAVVSLRAQAQALEPFLDAPSEVPVILVGHSLGAGVVAEAAYLYPDRVDGILILAGALDPGLEHPLWVQSLGRWPPFSWMLPREMDNANRELLAYKDQLQRLEPHLAEIDVPVDVIHGAQDSLVPFANVPFIRRHFAAAPLRVTRIENADHFLPWNDFALVRNELNGFLARICTPQAVTVACAR